MAKEPDFQYELTRGKETVLVGFDAMGKILTTTIKETGKPTELTDKEAADFMEDFRESLPGKRSAAEVDKIMGEKADDVEFEAMRRVIDILNGLDVKARPRVMAYLASRYG